MSLGHRQLYNSAFLGLFMSICIAGSATARTIVSTDDLKGVDQKTCYSTDRVVAVAASARGVETGREVWLSEDGREWTLIELNPGTAGSNPSCFVSFQRTLYCIGELGGAPHVFCLDGNSVAEVRAQSVFDKSPTRILATRDCLFILTRSQEVWKRTASGETRRVWAPTTLGGNVSQIVVAGGSLFFSFEVERPRRVVELWSTNGSPDEPLKAPQSFADVFSLIASGDKVAFVAVRKDREDEVWVAAGSADNAKRLCQRSFLTRDQLLCTTEFLVFSANNLLGVASCFDLVSGTNSWQVVSVCESRVNPIHPIDEVAPPKGMWATWPMPPPPQQLGVFVAPDVDGVPSVWRASVVLKKIAVLGNQPCLTIINGRHLVAVVNNVRVPNVREADGGPHLIVVEGLVGNEGTLRSISLPWAEDRNNTIVGVLSFNGQFLCIKADGSVAAVVDPEQDGK